MPGQIADDDFRVDLEHGAELQHIGGGTFFGFDPGIAGHAQVLGAQGLAEGFFHGGIDGFGTGLRFVSAGHHLERHLARTESRHLHRAGEFLETELDILADVRQGDGQIDAALQCARGFLSGLHAKRSRWEVKTMPARVVGKSRNPEPAFPAKPAFYTGLRCRL